MDPNQQGQVAGLSGLALAGLFSAWQATVNYLKWREELRYNYKVEREAKEAAIKRLRRRGKSLKKALARIAELEGRQAPDDERGPRIAGGGAS